MAIHKLESTDAFVARDFEPEVTALGIVRAAKKILQGGAKELARSQTYQCAAFNMKIGGASAGVSALPDDRVAALKAFVSEVLPQTTVGSLMLDAGKGVEAEALAELQAADPRSDALLRQIDGIANRCHLDGLCAAAAAGVVQDLEGQRLAIENFTDCGPSLARSAAARGARITAVATAEGLASNADGFDVEALVQAHAEHGADMIGTLTNEPEPFWKILGADVDVLFAGSKMGLIDHKNAEAIQASLVVPTGSIPYTTKAAIMLERADVTVLPDFVTTAGPLFAGMPPGDDDQASIEATATSQVVALTETILGQSRSPILEACHRAESFLATWRDELPFGRPFAP